MKAIVQDKYGAPGDVLDLQEIENPAVQDDEVLVRVRASAVAKGDWLVMRGLPYIIRLMGFGLLKPKNSVPGLDVAGTVEAVGSEVTQFQPGVEVFGWCNGAFAEYASVSEGMLLLRVHRRPARERIAETGQPHL